MGDELDVQAVITGRVTPRGDTLVVGAELTDVRTVAQLWGQQYTREMPDIPELQDEITRDILVNRQMELGNDAPRGPPDPTHAEAHMMQAFVLNVGGQPEAALAEARRAFDLDPVSAPVVHALGAMLAANGQHEEAVEQLALTVGASA